MEKKKFRSPDFNEIYDQFNQFISIKKYKTGNGQMYLKAVREFLTFMEKTNVQNLAFNRDQLTAYYDYLIQRPSKRKGTLSDNTINHHLFAVRLLFDLILETGKAESLPLLPKFHRGQYEYKQPLSVDEIKHLYSLCETKLETALLSVAYGCGLRRSEIERLDIVDIDFAQSFLIVRKGKYAKRREIPLSQKVMDDLRDYLYNERSEYLKYHETEKAFFVMAQRKGWKKV